jgi:hypothetical protein
MYIYIICIPWVPYSTAQEHRQVLSFCFGGGAAPSPTPPSRLFYLNPSLHICKCMTLTRQMYFSTAHSRVPIHMLTCPQP